MTSKKKLVLVVIDALKPAMLERAIATGRAPSSDRALSMRRRGTHACTTAEMKNPNTSAHHTSQAIRNESLSPCQITFNTSVTDAAPSSFSKNVPYP